MSRILIIGAGGTIGKIITPEIGRQHTVITAGRKSGDFNVDISSSASLKKLFRSVKNIDACICVAGDSHAGSITSLTVEQLNTSIRSKLLGQVNLVRIGIRHINENGVFILTSGKMGDSPIANSSAKAIANGGINSFVKAASLESYRGIRINAISPAKLTGANNQEIAKTYLDCITADFTGRIINLGY